MTWWVDFVAIKWIGFRDILAVLLGKGLESLLLVLFGWSMGYYVMLPIVRAAASDSTFGKAIGLIPQFAQNLIPCATAVVFGSLPWLIPFLPVLRQKPLEHQENDPQSN
jgi:hypothetical protein